MSETFSLPIGPAAKLTGYTDSRFKTLRLSVHMLTPLAKETAALYGILPGLITRATREYPDFAALSRRLSSLYGADLSAYARRIGGFQCLTLSASGISSRYAFGGDDMFKELSGLLFSALFEPLLDEEGHFPEEHFEQERRQLLELKDSEYGDKGTYTHARCDELLFENDPAGIDRYGSREDILALKREELLPAWENLLKTAGAEVFALGDCEPDPEFLKARFESFGKSQLLEPLPFKQPAELRQVTEEQPLSQSKLSLGFRVDYGEEENPAFQLMNAVLGGTPSSKLFQNVREHMGLCYYCSSMFSPLRRSLFIESGVETENLDAAEEAIFEQLHLLQNGEVTEDELNSAKLSLRNSYLSMADSLVAVESWYLAQAFNKRSVTPERMAERIMDCTKEQVITASQKLYPAVSFRLKGSDC